MKIINGNLNRLFFYVLVMFVLSYAYIYSEDAKAATFDVPTDFATIQEAIDDPGTMNGDTINVLAGTHVESAVFITKELIIQGQGIGVTMLEPSPPPALQIVLYPQADNIIIRDMSIQNGGTAIRFELAGQTIDSTDLIRVEMLNNTSRGIEIHNATTITNLFIDECNFENNNHGLRIASSGHLDGAEIQDSFFSDNVIGFYMANDGNTSTMSDVRIRRNTFMANTGQAIYFEEGQDIRILANTFVDNRRDIQILKWYNPGVPVSNITISNNTMTGTTSAVFAIFNADNGGATMFNNVRFVRNEADTTGAGGSAVFAGAYRTSVGAGTGWNTVRIRNNCFTGLTAGDGVIYFVPAGVDPLDPLGGATVNITNNWWGTANAAAITALMQVPDLAVNDYMPFRTTNICATVALQPIVPGDAGVVNDFNVSEASSNGDVAIVVGVNEAPNVEASEICRKLVLGIDRPRVLDMTTADAKGNATVSVDISPRLFGETLKFQAVDMATCTGSNVVTETF